MSDPTPLSAALAELIARKGLARVQGDAQLVTVWKQVVGEQVAAATRVISLQRGVFEIGVANSALLSDLATFQKPALLLKLKSEFPQHKVRDIKFRLRSDIKK
jgi:predicted nucleic acid-binding Zn ribbon protein